MRATFTPGLDSALAVTPARRVLRDFVLATVPALSIGLWSLGAQSLAGSPASGVWQIELLAGSPLRNMLPEWLAAFALGALLFAPLALTAIAASAFWALVFARVRGRALDPGWFAAAWLFVLLLPAATPLPLAAIGLSFGLVFAGHVFGGTGRYIVSPVVAALVFLSVAYPEVFEQGAWLPGSDAGSTWAQIVSGPMPSASLAAWIPAFLGREIDAFAAPSTLACLCGALFLVWRGAASARTMLAALAGLVLTSLVCGGLAWHWQLALGSFAFVTAFVATDPTTLPRTGPGIWARGLLFGALTIVIRTFNPDHPDGTVSAALLAGLAAPLLDYIADAIAARRPRAREVRADE